MDRAGLEARIEELEAEKAAGHRLYVQQLEATVVDLQDQIARWKLECERVRDNGLAAIEALEARERTALARVEGLENARRTRPAGRLRANDT